MSVKVPEMGIRLTRLDSGLTVVTDAMPSVESASVGLWVGVGTATRTRPRTASPT